MDVSRRGFLQGITAAIAGARLLTPEVQAATVPESLIIMPEAAPKLSPDVLVRFNFKDGWKIDFAPDTSDVEISTSRRDWTTAHWNKETERILIATYTDVDMKFTVRYDPDNMQKLWDHFTSREQFYCSVRFPNAETGYDWEGFIRGLTPAAAVEERQVRLIIEVAGSNPQLIQMNPESKRLVELWQREKQPKRTRYGLIELPAGPDFTK